MISLRAAAARVLLAIGQGETTLGAEVERWRSEVPDRDRALFLELTTGTLRWRNELDAVIAAASQRVVREIRSAGARGPPTRDLPASAPGSRSAHAVVHQAVDTIRQLDQPKLTGF